MNGGKRGGVAPSLSSKPPFSPAKKKIKFMPIYIKYLLLMSMNNGFVIISFNKINTIIIRIIANKSLSLYYN
jgi:hypothetical protein